MSDLWMQLPLWAQYLVQGLGLFTVMSLSAVIVSRAGRNPYWALLAIVPFFPVVGIWLLAVTRWPSLSGSSSTPEQ